MSAWPETVLCDLLGTEHPIIQAPMAGMVTPALAAAVSYAGGLGSLGSATLSPEELRAEVEALRGESNRPFNANFFVHDAPLEDGQDEATMQRRLASYYNELGLGNVPGGECHCTYIWRGDAADRCCADAVGSKFTFRAAGAQHWPR